MSDRDDFYCGVIACLAVVALYDQQTLFDEIVRTVDETKLVKIARKNGDMRWSGLSRYGYGRGRPETGQNESLNPSRPGPESLRMPS